MESTPAGRAVFVSPTSLAAAFTQVPDPRRAASVVYPLSAILAMAVAAILANHLSVLAIAEWGARQESSLLTALGFPDGHTPCQSTVQRLLRHLDGDAVAAALTAYFRPPTAPASTTLGTHGVAVDGKAQRGRLRFAATSCPVHALSAFCHDQGVVLAHEPIAAEGDKAEAELTVAPALLARLDWSGRVLTGDALFCQRALCQQSSPQGVTICSSSRRTRHGCMPILRSSSILRPPCRLPPRPIAGWHTRWTTDMGGVWSAANSSPPPTCLAAWTGQGPTRSFAWSARGATRVRPSARSTMGSPA